MKKEEDREDLEQKKIDLDYVFYCAILIMIAITAIGMAWLRIEFLQQKSFNQFNERIEAIESKLK